MKRTLALVLCVALSAPGCASARVARTSVAPIQTAASSADPVVIAEYVQKLPAGSRIRVDTTSGRTLRGTLIKANEDELVVQRNTRVPVPPESLAMKDVARVFVESGSSNGKLMAVGAAIGAGAAVGILWLITIIVFAND